MKLRKLSMESVENTASFDDFKKYLHVLRPVEEELRYIAKNVNGKTYYVYRPQGLSCVISDMLNVPNGLYTITYTSLLPTDLGRAYLPVEIEVYLLNRSGRDETGYFSPLQ